MSIQNKHYQGYHIKFNNQNVNYTTISINDIKTKIRIKLFTNSTKNDIQLHIDSSLGTDNECIIGTSYIINANMYNKLINLHNCILKEKADIVNDIIILTIKDFLESIGYSKDKPARIKVSFALFNYLCINKWFVIDPSNGRFSETVMSKILQFIMDDFVDDKKNRDKMILFYLFLFHLESITANNSTKTKEDHAIKTYSIEDKYDSLYYSNSNLDYYLDNL